MNQENKELAACPMCGGEAHITKGYATEQVWPHGVFHRVFCSGCQLRQLFYRTPEEAITAWNSRTPTAAPARQAPQAQGKPSDEQAVAAMQTGFTTAGIHFPAADRADELRSVAAGQAQGEPVAVISRQNLDALKAGCSPVNVHGMSSSLLGDVALYLGPAAQADEVRDALVQALEDIADPISAMKRDVPDGHVLNPHIAVQQADDPQWYKRRAQQALDALRTTAADNQKG